MSGKQVASPACGCSTSRRALHRWGTRGRRDRRAVRRRNTTGRTVTSLQLPAPRWSRSRAKLRQGGAQVSLQGRRSIRPPATGIGLAERCAPAISVGRTGTACSTRRSAVGLKLRTPSCGAAHGVTFELVPFIGVAEADKAGREGIAVNGHDDCGPLARYSRNSRVNARERHRAKTAGRSGVSPHPRARVNLEKKKKKKMGGRGGGCAAEHDRTTVGAQAPCARGSTGRVGRTERPVSRMHKAYQPMPRVDAGPGRETD
jgi:hypothetical protein